MNLIEQAEQLWDRLWHKEQKAMSFEETQRLQRLRIMAMARKMRRKYGKKY